MDQSKKEKPLPQPPNTPFGRKKRPEEQGNDAALLADRMAAAAAEGRLDEFLKQEMPDSEYARNLASMMMGMSGMMPMGAPPTGGVAAPASQQPQQEPAGSDQTIAAGEVPDDVKKAIQGGDVQALTNMLRREHQKRNPGQEQQSPQAPPQEPASLQEMPGIDKELIDALIAIAKDNSVTLDWIILRAIKVYVQEYQKNGKL